jgi:DNA-binding transcriptional LysR family regulator
MIEKLEYLIALAQEKHFGRAAELCSVSQPSLSLGLKQLETVTWEMVSRMPLCLLTPDTENRRFIEELLRSNGESPSISVESDSMSVLFAHVRTGAWVSIVPDKVTQSTGISDKELKVIPIVEPDAVHTVGLVMPERDLITPLATALATQARLTASELLH